MEALSRGYKINYLSSGSGPALLMIPGILMSIERWIDFGYVEAFADRYRVLVVDPLGHGASDKPHDADAYQRAGCAEDIVAVLDREGVEAANLWGFSRGGLIASVTATLFPKRARSLTVGGASVQDLPVPAPVEQWRRKQAETLRRGDWDAFWPQFGVPLDAATKEIFQKGNDPVAIAAAIEGDLLPGPRIDLAGFEGPIFVYAGSEEPTLALMSSGAEALSARFEVIEGMGHAGAFQAIDAVAPLVRRHLETAGS